MLRNSVAYIERKRKRQKKWFERERKNNGILIERNLILETNNKLKLANSKRSGVNWDWSKKKTIMHLHAKEKPKPISQNRRIYKIRFEK